MENFPDPVISVVIPAHRHSAFLFRAVQSALRQTFNQIEIIVVLNGPKETLEEGLKALCDSRLRIKTIPASTGLGAGRNAGVLEARGTWVAFLNENDEWFPRKLEIQLKTARESQNKYPVISCRLIGRRAGADFIWPRRFPNPGEDLSDYLFCRRSPFYGEGLIKPSTIFAKKELLQKIPFREDLKQHEDYDWLLKVKNLDGVGIQFANPPEPLAVWNMDDDQDTPDLEGTLSWLQENKLLFTPGAYASFLLTGFGHCVARERNWKAFFPLLREAFRNGRPSASGLFLYGVAWLTPQGVQRKSAAGFAKRRGLTKKPAPVISEKEEGLLKR